LKSLLMEYKGEKTQNLAHFSDQVDGFGKHQLDGLIKKLRSEINQFQKKSDQTNVVKTLLYTAIVLRGQHKFVEAIRFLLNAKDLFTQLEMEEWLTFCLYELSICNRELDRNSLAIDYGHTAILRFQKSHSEIELALAYNNMAIIHINLFNKANALSFAKKARVLFKLQKWESGLAWNATILGSLYFDLSDYKKSRQFSEEALDIFTRTENKQGMAWSKLCLAVLNREQCHFEEARKLLEEAKPLFEQLSLKDRVGWCYLNESALQRLKGDEEKALALNKKASQIFSPIRNHDGVAWSLFQNAQIFRDRGLLTKAWQTFREAMNLHSDIGNHKGVAWSQVEWGRTFLDLSEPARATECFEKAIAWAEESEEGPLKLTAKKNLGSLLIEKGSLRKGNELLDQTVAICEKNEINGILAETLLEKTKYHMLIQDWAQAKKYLNKAQKLIRASSLGYLEPNLGIFKGELQISEGNVEEGQQILEETLTLAKRIHHRFQRAQALIGLVQLRKVAPKKSDLPHIFSHIDLDVRSLGSRKMKAKYILVKAMTHLKIHKTIDPKFLSLGLRILQSAGLVVLERQILQLFLNTPELANFEESKIEFEERMRQLMDTHDVDLHLIQPRFDHYKHLPVSLII